MSGNLEEKVYEIQMLKQHYSINSSNAYVFMRSEAAYEQLRSKVNHALKPKSIQLQLSWQEISNLCENTYFVIGDALNEAHFQHSGDFNYFEVSDFNDALLNSRKIPWARYIPGKPGLCTRDNIYKEVTFQFDYAHFLKTFAKAQKQGHDKQEAFRQAFLIFRDSAEPYLTSPEGEPLSYPKFVEIVDTYGKKIPIEEITQDQDMIAETAGTKLFGRQLVENFREWQVTGSRNYEYATVQFHKVTQEERKFLYGLSNEDNPYERAIREKTDKRLETERSIALHYILGNYELVGNHTAIITSAAQELAQALGRRRERHQKLMRLDAPGVVINNEKISVEKSQYTLLAIKKNRKWLEEVLNR